MTTLTGEACDDRTWPANPVRTVRDLALGVVLPLAAWVGLVALVRSWGWHLRIDDGTELVLPDPPLLTSRIDELPGLAALAWPLVVGAVLVVGLPIAARRLGWRGLLALTVVASAGWAVGVAMVEGPDGLTRGLTPNHEYRRDVTVVLEDPAGFLDGFTDELGSYEIHVRGHPPGFVLLLAGMDSVGLGAVGWEAALVILGGAVAAGAVLVAVRDVAGEGAARAAAPFVALAPATIWIASSADAFYAGLSAVAVSMLVVATGRRGWASIVLAAAGGIVAGLAMMGSYGIVLTAAVPVAVAVWRRRPLPLLAGALAAFGVILAFVPFGFWWLDGLAATRHEYEVLSVERPYHFFVWNNLAAWGLALGPATVIGLARLRDRRLWLLVGGGLAAALLANVSGLSEGEVERIWLPFTVWVLAAGAAMARPLWQARVVLASQVATTVVIVALMRPQW
jgi:hypothetical protein